MTVDSVKLEESAVLIDLENIRLSWEKCYRRVFRYTDLCWLCLLLERHFQTNVGRIVVFMSNPEECRGALGEEQLNEMLLMYRYLQEDQARSAPPNGEFIKETQSPNIETKVERELLKTQEICLRNTVLSSEKNNFVETCRSWGANKSPVSSDCNNIVVDLCSEDDDDDDDYKQGGCFGVEAQPPSRETLSSSSLSEAESLDDVVLITEKESEALYSQGKEQSKETLPPRFSRTSVSEASDVDEVEWIMSVDTPRVSSMRQLPEKNCIDNKLISESSCSSFASSKNASEKKTQFQVQDLEQPFTRLGQDTCPQCQVIVKAFGYKMSGRRRVQRCCDVAIGNEVTKICFMARYSSIFLFSADSDFEETARSCVETENYEGVIKYAKPIRILGFSFAFESSTAQEARTAFLKRRALRNEAKKNIKFCSQKNVNSSILNDVNAGISVFFVDYEFPVIRRVLNRSCRPILQQYVSGGQNNSSFTLSKRTSRHVPKDSSNVSLNSSYIKRVNPENNLHSPLLGQDTASPLAEASKSFDTESRCTNHDELGCTRETQIVSDLPVNLFRNSPSCSVLTRNPSNQASLSRIVPQSPCNKFSTSENSETLHETAYPEEVEHVENNILCMKPNLPCHSFADPTVPISFTNQKIVPGCHSVSNYINPTFSLTENAVKRPRFSSSTIKSVCPNEGVIALSSSSSSSWIDSTCSFPLCHPHAERSPCDTQFHLGLQNVQSSLLYNLQSYANFLPHHCTQILSDVCDLIPRRPPRPQSQPLLSMTTTSMDSKSDRSQCPKDAHTFVPSSLLHSCMKNSSLCVNPSSAHSDLEMSYLSEISSEDDDTDDACLLLVPQSQEFLHTNHVAEPSLSEKMSMDDSCDIEILSKRTVPSSNLLRRTKKTSRSKYITTSKRVSGRYGKHIHKSQIHRAPSYSRNPLNTQPCFKHMKWVSNDFVKKNFARPSSYRLV